MISDLWIAVMEGKKTEQSYRHIAFKIDEAGYDAYLEKIQNLGLEIKSGRNRMPGEGRSIYFYDYDNHLFELHTGTLESGLRCYREAQAEG